MTLDEVRSWVDGVLSLASCGGSHEIERDEELRELAESVEDGSAREDGFVVTDEAGRRFLVSVREID